jgi:hypothetical protein
MKGTGPASHPEPGNAQPHVTKGKGGQFSCPVCIPTRGVRIETAPGLWEEFDLRELSCARNGTAECLIWEAEGVYLDGLVSKRLFTQAFFFFNCLVPD